MEDNLMKKNLKLKKIIENQIIIKNKDFLSFNEETNFKLINFLELLTKDKKQRKNFNNKRKRF